MNLKIYLFIFTGLISIFFVFSYKFSWKPDNKAQTRSVLTFAYNSLRSGKAQSLIDANKNIKIKKKIFKQGVSADHHMPLYINGFLKKEAKFFPNKRVLIFSDKKILKAVDIDKNQIIWKTQLFSDVVSTPVINLETGSIYVLTIKWEKDIFNAPADPPVYHHELFLIKMNGSIEDRISINLAALMGFEDKKNRLFRYVPRVHCKTALGLNLEINPPYVYFGCSIDTTQWMLPPPYKSYNYGDNRGIHGSVIAVELHSNGTFTRNTKAFLTSTVATHPLTGFDTGVYNVGSGPSVLSDGSLLIATGNGPTFPKQNNFGCSIVLVNGSSLKVKRRKKGEPSSFSIDTKPQSECWYENIEYASSSIASVKKNKKYFSAVTRKDGYLTVFDPYGLNGPHSIQSTIPIGERNIYGQPVIFINNQQQVNTFSVSQFFSNSPEFSHQEFLADKDTIKSFNERDFKVECFGYASTTNSNNKTPLYLMYSGNIRDVYTNAIKNSYIYKSLITPLWRKDENWAPFFIVKTLGYIWSKKSSLYNPNMEFKQLDFKSLLEVTDFSKTIPLGKKIKEDKNKYFFLRDKLNPLKCQNTKTTLKPLYKLTRRKKPFNLKEGLSVYSFTIQDNYSLKKEWEFYDKNLKPYIANPVLSVNIKNKTPVLILAANDYNKGEDKSFLILLNGKSGQLIGKTAFLGDMYFSMPLVIDNLIFIPTALHGIKKFVIKPAVFNKF